MQALPLLAENGMAQGCERSQEAVGLLPVLCGRSKLAAVVLCQVPADSGRSCCSFLNPLEPSPEVMRYHQGCCHLAVVGALAVEMTWGRTEETVQKK